MFTLSTEANGRKIIVHFLQLSIYTFYFIILGFFVVDLLLLLIAVEIKIFILWRKAVVVEEVFF